MLIVVSPAKTLDYETPLPISKTSQPAFMKRSAELVEILREYTPKKLAGLMSISDKLAELNVNRYESWEPKATKKNARQALLAFKGDVYQGIDAYSMKEADFLFAQEHLRMLSGLYGILRPLDLMQPYRLEMGTKLTTPQGSNLYDFWGPDITDALNKQLKKIDSDVLLNLASNEYFKSVLPSRLKARVVSPVFKDMKNGKYKIISFFAKKARGTMSGWIIRKKVTDLKKLTKFAEDGYRYSADGSTEDKPLFLRG
ncbi:peroxide stress protein YaaA [Mariniblastus fucicola]|uniref:UPF0246 protein MFFC18_03140 n=1 Tax=Mariniblastus fucicola TaxID=980251 RepID=A0A5B9P793_9BACT|nr:peroxide stress protein YaaA [Mariniblastus fucicola]QEG20466.1 hypothetical protein MFFC18_03140 [Mariniblastus fucicola]